MHLPPGGNRLPGLRFAAASLLASLALPVPAAEPGPGTDTPGATLVP